MKTSLLILLLHLLSSLSLFAQYTIRGSVKDSLSNGIPFVSVVLANSGDSSVVKVMSSDEYGNYVFENITAGKYRVAASAMDTGDLLYSGKPADTGLPDRLRLANEV